MWGSPLGWARTTSSAGPLWSLARRPSTMLRSIVFGDPDAVVSGKEPVYLASGRLRRLRHQRRVLADGRSDHRLRVAPGGHRRGRHRHGRLPRHAPHRRRARRTRRRSRHVQNQAVARDHRTTYDVIVVGLGGMGTAAALPSGQPWSTRPRAGEVHAGPCLGFQPTAGPHHPAVLLRGPGLRNATAGARYELWEQLAT